jgi:hypothetical protein
MVHSESLGMRWALKQLKRNCGNVWRPPHGGDTLDARLWPDDSQARFTGHLPTLKMTKRIGIASPLHKGGFEGEKGDSASQESQRMKH